MATKTTNYNLVKPDITEPSLIGDINANMDTIDTALKANADVAEAAQSAAESAQTAAENAQSTADEANAAIGDIGALLDTINGEVI
ncbi:MAG: hypothetical protein IJO29_01555 [Oscillospiraceae bacterium]|nr:hypothetical protein [Oscillospiraceae bacterium]